MSGVGRRCIENGFPTGFVSVIAERESWRKEINRPVYYVHKWWARRLGSVFRSIILGAALEGSADLRSHYLKAGELGQLVVYDPFMGSGTTIGEAVRLGFRAVGRDINPVPVFAVGAALRPYDQAEIETTFTSLGESVGQQIAELYRNPDPNCAGGSVLYYFWVMQLPCPQCGADVDLFPTRVFAKHAYVKRNPVARSVCPSCGDICAHDYESRETVCATCGTTFDPHIGNVVRSTATCTSCSARWRVVDAARAAGTAPKYRMYAKLVLDGKGQKEYRRTTDYDRDAAIAAEGRLSEVEQYIPDERIPPGHNTNQVLNYGFAYWRDLFNKRQLLALGMLAGAIAGIPDERTRSLFACLLSGCLEFNNMLVSYKGEGTGAVRHLFSHHILKPELMPIEANVWGTPKSSGAFSTLYRSRILRALEYKLNPFDITVDPATGSTYKHVDPTGRIEFEPARTWREFDSAGSRVYLSCGDSAQTDMPDGSVDLVITDPPFFDNVHYSELADFFYVWLRRLRVSGLADTGASTRQQDEVQSTSQEHFSRKLALVLAESRRVLKNTGLLVFTYHHSRIEGWEAMYSALRSAGFRITATHPVRAEMTVSVPVTAAQEPISCDLIVVCRPAGQVVNQLHSPSPLDAVRKTCEHELSQLVQAGVQVMAGDLKVIALGALMAALPSLASADAELTVFRDNAPRAIQIAGELYERLARAS